MNQLIQSVFYNLQLRLACQYIKICDVLIRRTIICENLVKMQYFRHEWSSIMYKNTQKRNKIKERSITCSHIRHIIWCACVFVFVRSLFIIKYQYLNSKCFTPSSPQSLIGPKLLCFLVYQVQENILFTLATMNYQKK